jgi:hypothetical protein
MDSRIERLGAWGCDVKGALNRMLDDEDFYLECLAAIPGDPNYAALEEALRAHDGKKAFDCAHTLKGVLANMGLTPLYAKTEEIVEPLRAGRCDGSLLERAEELNRLKDRLAEILES